MKNKNLIFILPLFCFYSCTPTNAVSTTANNSSKSISSPSKATNSAEIILSSIKTKQQLVNAYKCAIDISDNPSVKNELDISLSSINSTSEASLSNKIIQDYTKVLISYNLKNCDLSKETTPNYSKPAPTSQTPLPMSSNLPKPSIVVSGSIKTKEELFNLYNCIINSSIDEVQKNIVKTNFSLIVSLSDGYFTPQVIAGNEESLKKYNVASCY